MMKFLRDVIKFEKKMVLTCIPKIEKDIILCYKGKALKCEGYLTTSRRKLF